MSYSIQVIKLRDRLERRLIAKITGDFYFNLIRKLAKISLDKCDIAYELYLVAFDKTTNRHYMIFNFIEGRSLTWDEMREYGEQVKACIEKLHTRSIGCHLKRVWRGFRMEEGFFEYIYLIGNFT